MYQLDQGTLALLAGPLSEQLIGLPCWVIRVELSANTWGSSRSLPAGLHQAACQAGGRGNGGELGVALGCSRRASGSGRTAASSLSGCRPGSQNKLCTAVWCMSLASAHTG